VEGDERHGGGGRRGTRGLGRRESGGGGHPGDDLEIERRAHQLAGSRRSGRRWGDIVSGEPRPRLTELLSNSLRLLSENGVRFRRALAKAMHAEGMSTEEIARQFGVSRQRISNLLRRRIA